MAHEEIDPAQAREIINFQISYSRQQMKATWALALVIVAMYLLEEYFGGSQNIAVLMRMGANVSTRVKDGEYYRLFSAVFLHAGFMHVFFNTYVLFALGGFFNRILGESRYLTIFLLSGICGSLASVYFGKATVSVGASGAIWGLFGASLALAFFKTSFLPEAIRLRLRRITLINLVINLGVSFLPMIDFWAHIGGGVGGFLISLPIIFRPKSESFFRITNYVFMILAAILAFVYLASIAFVLTEFKPWTNQLHSELRRYDLDAMPFSIEVPDGLIQTKSEHATKTSASYVFGSPELDRVVIEAHFFHQAILGQPANKQWLSAQREELLAEASVPAQVKKTIYYRDTAEGGELYYQQASPSQKITVHNYVITRGEYAIKLGVMVSEDVPQAQIEILAHKIIESIQKK